MIETVWFAPQEVAAWVASQIPGCERGFGPNVQAMGVTRDGELVGGVVYHTWEPEAETIQLSAAGSGIWTNKSVIRQVWGYPFEFCQLTWARTDAANPARDIWRRLGANEYVIPRMLGRQKPGVYMTLTREAWDKGKFSNVQTAAADAARSR